MFAFFAFINVLKHLFYIVFEHQHNIGQTWAKNINSSHKTGYQKNIMSQPPHSKQMCFISCLFQNTKTLLLNTKRNLR